MTTFLLARHGETDWNRERRYQGHADTPLNALGREQARGLAERLAGVDLEAVYASDLRRALETAEIVARSLGLPVVTDEGLREIDVGSWQGLGWEERQQREWDGESKETHSERVLAALARIAHRHPDAAVLVVAHGGTLRRVQEAALGEGLPVYDNCGVWTVAVEDGRFRPID
jgi:broad specificity phosphatase PhoE